MPLPAVFEQAGVAGHQRVAEFPRRCEEDAVGRVGGRISGKCGGGDQNRGRHFCKRDTELVAETPEPVIGAHGERDFSLRREVGDFPRADRGDENISFARFGQFARCGFSQARALRNPDHRTGIEENGGHGCLSRGVPFHIDGGGQVRVLMDRHRSLERAVDA